MARKYKPTIVLPDVLKERVLIRPWVRDDVYFCRDSFRMAHMKSKQFGRCVKERDVIKGANGRFHRFMEWADFYMLTHADGEPILGWIAVTKLQTNTIVWFVYVKHSYRKMGLARHMIDSCTHGNLYYPFDTRKAANFALKFRATYDPFIYEELCFDRPDKETLYLRKFATGECGREQATRGSGETAEDLHL